MYIQDNGAPRRHVYTVSELNREARGVLEDGFGQVWVSGEISNFKAHMSGHCYFSLKDSGAQLDAALFRGALRNLKFTPEDGMEVVARGRLSIYEQRGRYQLVCDYMEPMGLGALQMAFEQMKARLEAEGLFDPARKRGIPVFPRRVGLVTSTAGAAIRDFLTTAERRFPGCDVLIRPAAVQGATAAGDLARALRDLNRADGVDVIAVVRGGGSLEDLWPFNEEITVRAIAGSAVPVVSGVGHETDYTLADFAADARALTPTDAARLCIPDAEELRRRVGRATGSSLACVAGNLSALRLRAERAAAPLARHEVVIGDARQRVDDALAAMAVTIQRRVAGGRQWVAGIAARAAEHHPKNRLALYQARRVELALRGDRAMAMNLREKRTAAAEAARLLNTLSPLNVLDRGYSVTFAPDGSAVQSSTALCAGDAVRLRFAKGSAGATVTSVEEAQTVSR